MKLKRPLAYEIDGGDRKPTTKLRIDVRPASVVVCVPVSAEAETQGDADVREPELAGAARHG